MSFYSGLLPCLEEQYGHLSKIEINEVLCLMSDIRAKVSSNYAMPCRRVLLIEFLLNIRGDIFFDREFFQCLGGDIYSVLLLVFVHICMLDHCFSISHYLKISELLDICEALIVILKVTSLFIVENKDMHEIRKCNYKCVL